VGLLLLLLEVRLLLRVRLGIDGPSVALGLLVLGLVRVRVVLVI
jgi:hypothetical protein